MGLLGGGEVFTTCIAIIYIWGGLFKFKDKFTFKFGHHTIVVGHGGHVWSH